MGNGTFDIDYEWCWWWRICARGAHRRRRPLATNRPKRDSRLDSGDTALALETHIRLEGTEKPDGGRRRTYLGACERHRVELACACSDEHIEKGGATEAVLQLSLRTCRVDGSKGSRRRLETLHTLSLQTLVLFVPSDCIVEARFDAA